MFWKLPPRGWLLNPLYRRNASTQWIRSRLKSSIKHFSTSFALQDNSPNEVSQRLTAKHLISQIPSGSNQPMATSAPIDWEAVVKIFKKRPALSRDVGFDGLNSGNLNCVPRLLRIPSYIPDQICIFKFETVNLSSKNCLDASIYGTSLSQCDLECNLSGDLSTRLGIPPEPPLKITALSNKRKMAKSTAILQLFLMLEEKKLLDAFLSLCGQQNISTEAKDALGRLILDSPAGSAAASRAKCISPNSHQIRQVFNYAASYLYIPRFKVTNEQNGPKINFTVEISLPEHGIHATATGPTLDSVEVIACENFKQKVEKYHIANAVPSQSTEGSNILTTENAKNFLDFYNHYNDQAVIRIIHEDGFWRGQALIKNSDGTHRELFNQEITMYSRDDLRSIVMLAMAVTLVKETPELLMDYKRKLDIRVGKYISKAPPMKLKLHQSSLDLMQRTVEATTQLGLSSMPAGEPGDENIPPFSRHKLFRCSKESSRTRSNNLRAWYCQRQAKHENQKVLPLTKHSTEVLDLVEKNQFSILVGQTGSGKTTQLPQIILDSYIRESRGGNCKIFCTQPRRIAATSVARRVAKERGQELGDQVGYHIGSDAIFPHLNGSITYCTTGIVLRQLMYHADDLFDHITHLIIDEVHERDVNIDFLLTMVKDIVKRRIEAGKTNPKVCLMSASVDAEMFKEYFSFTDKSGEVACPVLHVEGRAFPVEKYYLEDILDTFEKMYPSSHRIWHLISQKATQSYLQSERCVRKPDSNVEAKDGKAGSVIKWDSHFDDADSLENQMRMDMVEAQVPVDLAAIMIAHIASTTKDGAILVFLPGLADIHRVEMTLRETRFLNTNFNDEDKIKIFQLHSSVPGRGDVFSKVPPGCRKIILATNIAETSITIDDIKYVVDTGKHKESTFHQILGFWSLPSKWISQSSVKQRSGRAGRVQNGSYYALFSEHRHKSLKISPQAEMLRVDLQKICLEIKILGYKGSIQDFLAGAPEPPSPQAVQSSIESLKALGALSDTETVTPLGRLIGRLPLKPAIGKMIILGIIFRCLDPMIILGALNDEVLQVVPPDMRDSSYAAMRGFGKASKSDHIAMLNAYRALRHLEAVDGREVMQSFANQKFLSVPNFTRVRKYVRSIQQGLGLSGLVSNSAIVSEREAEYGGALLNENSNQYDLIRALVLHGSYPHIGVWDNQKSKYQIVVKDKVLLSVHPSSINHPEQQPRMKIEGIKSGSIDNAPLLSFNTLALLTDNKLVMQRTTAVTPFMASLFCGTLNQSDAKIGQVVVDQWIPFNVQSTDKPRDEEGTAAQILLKFNGLLRQMEKKVFLDLAKGEYDVDSEMSHIWANAVRQLLTTEEDIHRFTEEYEWNLDRSLKKLWNAPPEEQTPELPQAEETLRTDEVNSVDLFLELVEGALEVPATTKIDQKSAVI